MGLPEFLDNRHINVTSLSTLHTGCLYPQEIPLVHISVTAQMDPGPYNGRKDCVNEKKCNYPIENRTRLPPSCNAVPELTGPTNRAHIVIVRCAEVRDSIDVACLCRDSVRVKATLPTATVQLEVPTTPRTQFYRSTFLLRCVGRRVGVSRGICLYLPS